MPWNSANKDDYYRMQGLDYGIEPLARTNHFSS